MKQTKLMTGILLGVFFSSAAFAADENRVTLSGGFDYSSGKYGTANTTDIVSIPLNALYESGAWAFKLTVPYLRVSGDSSVVASGMHGGRRMMSSGMSGSTSTTSGNTVQSGLGDVVTMAMYNVYASDDSGTGIDLGGRIKFGTASKALGTGENDYALQMYAYRDIENFSPGIMLGYEVPGSSAALPLSNAWYGSVGSAYYFSDQTSAGLEYKYAQKASVTGAPQRELTLYAAQQMGETFNLRGYLLKGFADGSPDYGIGMTVAATF
ncbi:MAG: hypothetical protein PHQ60_13730 [Sideroxydans sp.]|nr:hypothetical protein [Sideroxydans sp.]